MSKPSKPWSAFEEGHYVGWRKARMLAIKKYMNPELFYMKNLTELGGGAGHNGNEFYKLGCTNVECLEARTGHIQVGQRKFPHINFLKWDGDKNRLAKKKDIILHWGLLYHLREIENHLKNVCKNCDILLLETEVSDSSKDNFSITIDETGPGQAFNRKGMRPSRSYIEKVLKTNGFKYKLINDKILNFWIHEYDWPEKNDDKYTKGQRRFWICWNKNTISEKELFTETESKFDDDIYPKQIHNFNNSSKNNNEPHSSETETETETETSKAELEAKIIELQRKNEDLITRNTILQERISELKGQKHALI